MPGHGTPAVVFCDVSSGNTWGMDIPTTVNAWVRSKQRKMAAQRTRQVEAWREWTLNAQTEVDGHKTS